MLIDIFIHADEENETRRCRLEFSSIVNNMNNFFNQIIIWNVGGMYDFLYYSQGNRYKQDIPLRLICIIDIFFYHFLKSRQSTRK